MLELLPRVESHERSKYVGASDVAGILGLSDYKTPMGVWMEKTGRAPPIADNAAMERGRFLERGILDWAAHRLGAKVVEPGVPISEPGIAVPGCAVLSIHPDGAIDGALAEVKTSRIASQWGEAGTDVLPDAYLCQVQAQMAIAPIQRAHVCAFLPIQDELRLMVVERDQGFIDYLLNEVGHFWEKHVKADTPPRLDHTDATKLYLTQKYGRECGLVRTATEDELRLVQAWRATKEAADEVQQQLDLAAAELKNAIGTADGLTGPFGRVTWRWQDGARRWDNEALEAALGARAESCKKQGEPVRVLRFAKK